MSVNKRAGREEELRAKMKATIERFEDVFGKPLSTMVLKEFLDESEKWNRINFLRDRMGVLSDTDVNYLRNILKENVISDTHAPKLDDESLDDVDDDIDIDELINA